MQPITIQLAVTVGLYVYIIFYQRRVDIIDQVELWTPRHRLHIYPLSEIFYFRAIDN